MEIHGIKIEFLGHSGFKISTHEKSLAIDPYNISPNVEKVDYILITHSHYDHCSIKDITRLARPGTLVIIPADAQSKITRIEGVQMQVVEVGDEIELDKFKIEVLPAYNVGKDFHPRSEGWHGYIVKHDKVIVYHAGDTDKTKEMKKLTGYSKHDNTFIALLPVSGTYVMAADEAAEVAKFIHADIAIPMHYGAGVAGTIDDAKKFADLCKAHDIETRVLEKI